FVMALLLFQVQFRTVAFGKPRLTLLIDTSASMSLTDQYNQDDRKRLEAVGLNETSVSRLDLAKQLLTGFQADWVANLEREFAVEVSAFDVDLHPRSNVAVREHAIPFRSAQEKRANSLAQRL